MVVPRQTGRIDSSMFSNAIANISPPSSQPQPTAQRAGNQPITAELFQQFTANISAAPVPNRSGPSAEEVRDNFRSNPDAMQQLTHRDPLLAEAILSDDIEMLRRILQERYEERMEQRRQRNAEIERLNKNPYDPEAQKRIEELIRLEQVQKNYEEAVELNPESFGRVVMLYIDCMVNGKPVKAFVDSGAQITLMSVATAERCGIMRLVDRRFSQTLVGVGTCQAIGRVHSADINIGGVVYTSAFTIVEHTNMEFLLGLDMLRKHRCAIDLSSNTLKIGDGEVEVPFLAEKDIPKHLLEDKLPHSLTNSTESLRNSMGDRPTAEYPDDVIQNLMSLGNFTRDQVVAALKDCAGNQEQAASQL
eukprot:CAMPEP_0117013530 /NCGR_PEP_ID=MMETSP0472-20121206/11148_1 /TAXON_ID=693140 ORGANISM="Tiarina fusus, Strain LIS" /NCGR_SAMPLE_ID=MMETSP0472 /ASSEMBLY_ACC=CAM_ASM_000603 /LENGTH=361 /DNA_ID=CAMNT_0004716867 /DNA_START=188 /DNA_END=1269 /DNA_ORIENTATION=+